ILRKLFENPHATCLFAAADILYMFWTTRTEADQPIENLFKDYVIQLFYAYFKSNEEDFLLTKMISNILMFCRKVSFSLENHSQLLFLFNKNIKNLPIEQTLLIILFLLDS